MDKLSITLPKAWSELDDQQLYYVFNLVAENLSSEQIRTYCLFRFGQVKMICRYGKGFLVKKEKVEYLVDAETITVAIQSLNFLDDVPEQPVRISKIKGCRAVDAQLQELDAKYTETVENAALKTVVFGDRFPFRYMTDDYGLTYYAAFTGCSAESEASFETIAFLAGKADELNLPAVLTIEGGNHKIADTVISASAKADRKVLTMNSMQSVTADDVKNGMTYLSIMEENLTVLKEALN